MLNKFSFLLMFVLSCFRLEAQIKKSAVVAFVYHRFDDSRFPSTSISKEHFKAHLEYLKKEGISVMTMEDALVYLESDKPTKRIVVLTIDDGYKSFLENGLPLLVEYGFPATLFVNTESVGHKDYMDWGDLQKCMDRGVSIGNHTASHAYFLNAPDSSHYQRFQNELKESHDSFKRSMGIVPTLFAYPYGEFDPEMKNLVAEAGFKAAAAQNSGVIYPKSAHYQLPRFPMNDYYGELSAFKSKVNMLPLEVKKITPESYILPKHVSAPELEISFARKNLDIRQMQCFVQGCKCDMDVQQSDSLVTVSLKSTSPITSRRRTLYTLTVRDMDGFWHWYSHLWINTEKE